MESGSFVDCGWPVELATLEVLSDPELVEQIEQGEREIEAGEGIPLEELTAELGV